MIYNLQQQSKGSAFAFFVFILIIPSFFSCEKKNIAFGENFAESYANIVLVDTLTPFISTIIADSFLTSNTSTIQLGNFRDETFGTIDARSFFQCSIPASTTIPADAVFDSLTLKLVLTKNYYGDTGITQLITVSELTSKLAYSGENTGFYNTSFIPFSSTPLGTKQFNPAPNKTDSMEIRLSDAKGQEFFTKLKGQATELTDQTYFLQYFKGLMLSTAPTSSSIIGYSATDSTLRMRLYYTEKNVTMVNKYIDFNFSNPELQFNKISIDRSNTVFASMPKNTEIPSSALKQSAYLQTITGIYTKIKFPSLPDLLTINQSGKILNAQLIIKPLAGTFSNIYRLPPELNLVTTDKYNQYGTVLTAASGSSTGNQNGNLTVDYLYGESTSYTYDITSYLQEHITVSAGLENGLLLYPPEGSSTTLFNRLIIGDSKTGSSKIQVNIFFLSVD